MPPRYPVGSILGGLFMATIFPIMSKVPFKKLNPAAPVIDTGTDFNTIDAFTDHNTTNLPLITSSTTGLLPLFLSFLTSILSIFGEELINTSFMYVLHIYVVPFLMTFYALLVSKLRKITARPDPKDVQKPRPIDHELQHLRAIASHGAGQVSDLKESLSKTEREKRDAVSRSEEAEKAKIEAIANLTRKKSKEIADLEAAKDKLTAAMRDAVDPRGLYPDEDVLRLAKDLQLDFRRVAEKLERKRRELKHAQETGQLAQKDQQISELTTANSALDQRVTNLETSLRDAAELAEWAETTSQETQKRLRDRALEAERVATSGAIPVEGYRRKLSEIHDLQVAVTTAQQERQQAVNAEGLLRSQLEGEKAKTINLQNIIDNELEARQQSEDSEAVPATTTSDLQLAEDRIAILESEALARDEKARIATEKVAENATTATELEQKLQESRDQANELLAGELEKKEKALKKISDEQINDLRAQLDQATQQKPESSDLEKQRLRDEGYEKAVKDFKRQAELLVEQAVQQASREAGERLTAAVSQKEHEVQASIQEKWQQENRDAGERLAAAVSQKEQEVQALFEQRWTSREAEWSANFDAECNKRVNTMALDSQNPLDGQLQAAVQRAIQAERRLDNPEGELREARAVANKAYDGATKQWKLAEAAEARAKEAGDKAGVESDRADAAEAEVAKYKKGKENQDGRMRNLHDEIATLKRSRPEVAEYQATKNELARAQAVICEYCNRCYDWATRNVVVRLCKANDKIEILKELLEKPTARPSRGQLLGIIVDAEVGKEFFLKLSCADNRQVVIRQSAAVDAKLMTLKYIINKSKEPNKAEILAEILKPRGDEHASWDMEPGPPDPPVSDEDEDEDRNASESAEYPAPQVPALPTGPRPRQPKNTEGQNAPLPIDPNSDNPLKRKGGDGEMGPDGSGKRHDTSTMGMRPIGNPFAQGSSFPDANDGQSEAKLESQDDFQTDSPFPERIGEATAPEQQSNDQTDLSPQLPGSPSFLVQLSTPFNAAISSQDLSHVEHALHPKPTKIPVPTVSSQEAAAPSSSEAPTGFSFSVPKDIASAVVKQTPTQQYHSPIFTGLSRLGAAMADNNSALPGLPPTEDEVLEFESSAVTEDQDSDSEPDDEFLGHIASDVEEDDETAWENALYPEERGDQFVINLHPQSFPDDGDDPPDFEPSTIRALDMTDQNYEEQAAEAAAALRNVQQDPSKKKSQPKGEVLEDNFHIDLD